MGYPRIVATATWNGNQNAQQAAIPAGVQAGDLVVVLWHRSGGTSTATNVDAKFTSLAAASGTNLGARCGYFIADGTEGGTTITCWSFPSGSDNAVSITYVIRDWDGLPEAGTYYTTAGATTVDPPAVSHSKGHRGYLYLIWAGCGAAVAVPSVTLPSGYTTEVSDERTSCGASAASRALTGSTDDPGTITWADAVSRAGMAQTIAIAGRRTIKAVDIAVGVSL